MGGRKRGSLKAIALMQLLQQLQLLQLGAPQVLCG